MYKMHDVINKIKELQEQRDISNSKIHTKSGVSRTTYASLKAGETEQMRLETFSKIAFALACYKSELRMLGVLYFAARQRKLEEERARFFAAVEAAPEGDLRKGILTYEDALAYLSAEQGEDERG